jgi:hypothetical protein
LPPTTAIQRQLLTLLEKVAGHRVLENTFPPPAENGSRIAKTAASAAWT